MIRILVLTVLALTFDRGLTSSAAEPANPEANSKGTRDPELHRVAASTKRQAIDLRAVLRLWPGREAGCVPGSVREDRPLARNDRP